MKLVFSGPCEHPAGHFPGSPESKQAAHLGADHNKEEQVKGGNGPWDFSGYY